MLKYKDIQGRKQVYSRAVERILCRSHKVLPQTFQEKIDTSHLVPVAQWIEHLTTDQEVGGSTPSGHATSSATRAVSNKFHTSEIRYCAWVVALHQLKVI